MVRKTKTQEDKQREADARKNTGGKKTQEEQQREADKQTEGITHGDRPGRVPTSARPLAGHLLPQGEKEEPFEPPDALADIDLVELMREEEAAPGPAPAAPETEAQRILGRARESARIAYYATWYQIYSEEPPGRNDRSQFERAADFVLAQPQAAADAIAIDLYLKKLGGSRHPSKTEAICWGVFRTVFLAVHGHLKQEAEARAAEDRAQEKRAGGGWPVERLAMTPERMPMQPDGFSPRHGW